MLYWLAMIRTDKWILRPSRVEIDLDALAVNVRELKQIVGDDVTLMAVVKANGYGHGAVAVSRVALRNGADYLGVSSMVEALELRDAGIAAPILVLSYTPVALVGDAVRQGITLTLYDFALAEAYNRLAAQMGRRLNVHIKVDTGMGRLGVVNGAAVAFVEAVATLPHLELEGIYTHFSVADERSAYTDEQAENFRRILYDLKTAGYAFHYYHAANSAATLASSDNHFNMVRVGLAMYGLSPSKTVAVPPTFRPVMSWKTVIAQVKTLPAGHPVGYGNTYRTQSEERIAIIPVGYADGLRRAPQTWRHVLVHGQPAPLVGRVSMEKTAISVSHIADVAIGDEVVLLGKQGQAYITAEQIGAWLGTINYEVVTSILPRVWRQS
ncbi:MAG: alanine racemase [Chloroflexi bacterium]|nr:MAG: alanine racemase [Chloroflexota bacterium]